MVKRSGSRSGASGGVYLQGPVADLTFFGHVDTGKKKVRFSPVTPQLSHFSMKVGGGAIYIEGTCGALGGSVESLSRVLNWTAFGLEKRGMYGDGV